MTQDDTRPLTKPKTGTVGPLNGKVPGSFDRPQIVATKVAGLTFWLCLAGFGLIGALFYQAATQKIQSAVVGGGTFEIEGDLQVVDHLEGGILSEILVREGDDVAAGQVLARLSSARVDAQLGVLRSQLASALAREGRLRAAMQGADAITFSPELDGLIASDPALAQVKETQVALFQSNRQSDLGEISIFDERIAQLNTRLVGLEGETQMLHAQLTIVEEELADLQSLFEKGLVSKARLYAREEDRLAVLARIGQRENERQDVLDQVAEVRERQLQVARDRRQRIADDQQVLTENIFDLRQRIRSYQDVRDRLDIRAPISGRIVGFEANTIGAVVPAGGVLMQIVPGDAPFMIEAQVATSDIDEIAVGRDARVRLSAYSFRTTPPIEGRVSYVSADSFFDEGAGVSYYKIHVQIPADAYANLPDKVTPHPGMPVQVMVATGEETVLTYLLDPVLSGLETAMIEGE
ncbi:HlyD family type I secretion periplasmic adaptor subunit [Aliishimia ponticola]|uniref:Membrane fusion protein (MFP) family protein n=1 Tax=Aliishimia ponticola TaxID=2499833 RepID=A0A4S4NFZ0_9RHOB|nr:HlyD family type I secretion periplasmic adaptor subunit [Aliishimia ponticola]THH38489.1 HlyD family type I secretion periplasmic adaptor subunit [Aliishimia ponticola]